MIKLLLFTCVPFFEILEKLFLIFNIQFISLSNCYPTDRSLYLLQYTLHRTDLYDIIQVKFIFMLSGSLNVAACSF